PACQGITEAGWKPAPLFKELLQQMIGEGGMVAVWMAEQQEPVRRLAGRGVGRVGGKCQVATSHTPRECWPSGKDAGQVLAGHGLPSLPGLAPSGKVAPPVANTTAPLPHL